MEQLLCETHERGTVTNSHCVEYTSANQSSHSGLLYDRTVQNILFRIAGSVKLYRNFEAKKFQYHEILKSEVLTLHN